MWPLLLILTVGFITHIALTRREDNDLTYWRDEQEADNAVEWTKNF